MISATDSLRQCYRFFLIFIAHLLVGDEKLSFLWFLMPEMTVLVHIHIVYMSRKLFSVNFSNGIQVENS